MDIERICKACRTPFTVTPEEMAYLEEVAQRQGWKQVRPPRFCMACRKRRREAPQMVPIDQPIQWYEADCRECGAVFRIGPRDVEWLRGQSWPKRCKPCRDARRADSFS